MEGMTVVAQFEDRTEAEIACGLLVSAGIAATLEEHNRNVADYRRRVQEASGR